jgi:hypothetical protein
LNIAREAQRRARGEAEQRRRFRAPFMLLAKEARYAVQQKKDSSG